jgi:hypothetical protein
MERPKPGGEHHDALESGLPSDKGSEGAGHSDKGTGYTPAKAESAEEKGQYGDVQHGNAKGSAGPMPSTQKAQGIDAKHATGNGRGSSGKFSGTMGAGQKGEPGLTRCKGAMGNC